LPLYWSIRYEIAAHGVRMVESPLLPVERNYTRSKRRYIKSIRDMAKTLDGYCDS